MRILCATVVNQDHERERCETLRALGCEIFDDFREMLRRHGAALDLCCIPTGIHLHAPMTIDALRAGANVFVEKPAAATIQDVRAMQAAERETGRFVAVGFQTMYARETLWMKQAIVGGEIGEVQSIKCRGLWPRATSYYERTGWAGRLKLDGHWVLDSPFNNAIAHQLNMICFLAGSEVERSARLATIQAELNRAHEIESADTAALKIVTETGLPLYYFVTHCPQELIDPEIIVRGSQGQIHWNFSRAKIDRADGSHEVMELQPHDELRDSIMSQLCCRMKNPSAFICGLDIAAVHTLAVNGAHDSARPQVIDERYVRRMPVEGGAKVIIEGIDDLIARAFEEEKMFSELGAGWARPGEVVSLKDYPGFPLRD